RRGLALNVASHDRHRGSTRSPLPPAVPSRLEVYVPALVAARRENEQRRLNTLPALGVSDGFDQLPGAADPALIGGRRGTSVRAVLFRRSDVPRNPSQDPRGC